MAALALLATAAPTAADDPGSGRGPEVTFFARAGRSPEPSHISTLGTGRFIVGDAARRKGSAPSPTTSRKSATVDIRNFLFNPDRIEVDAGETITWTNFDEDEHTATATDPEGAFDTGLLKKGESGSVTLDEPGTYKYFCSVHPGMKGQVVVLTANDSSGSNGSNGSGSSGGGGGTGDSADGGSGSAAAPAPSPTVDGGGSGSLPNTGLELIWLIAAGAISIAAGLLLAALELSLRDW